MSPTSFSRHPHLQVLQILVSTVVNVRLYIVTSCFRASMCALISSLFVIVIRLLLSVYYVEHYVTLVFSIFKEFHIH
jgi:hypothetical protein